MAKYIRLTRRGLWGIPVLMLAFFSVVMPNSFQNTTAVLLILSAIASLPIVNWNAPLLRLLVINLMMMVVTTIYMVVGLSNGAPTEAVRQVLIIYMLSPMLWLLVSAGIFSALNGKALDKWMLRFTFLACASVAVFFFLYFNFGRYAVSLFKANANLYMGEGSSTATIFVYGSLMFLFGGLFAASDITPARWWSLLLVGLGLAVTLTSGRHALFLSVVIGLCVGLIIRRRQLVDSKLIKKASFKSRVGYVFITIAGAVIAIFVLQHYQIISIETVLKSFADKIESGGGSERSGQFSALLEGVANNYGLGSGHGVGVGYIRSDDFPWRYEHVWAATLFRVGVLGTVIYCLPFLYYFNIMARLYMARRISKRDTFVFAGFAAAFVGSATNPYIEAFCFQWMYVFPVVYGCYRWSGELINRKDANA